MFLYLDAQSYNERQGAYMQAPCHQNIKSLSLRFIYRDSSFLKEYKLLRTKKFAVEVFEFFKPINK